MVLPVSNAKAKGLWIPQERLSVLPMCLGGCLYPTFILQFIYQDPSASTVHHYLLSTSGESNGASKEEAHGGSGQD